MKRNKRTTKYVQSGGDDSEAPRKIVDEEQISVEFMRGRDSDEVVVDDPRDEGIPIENLYSSAGQGDLHREGDAPDALTDLPDIPTPDPHTQDEELSRVAAEAIADEFGEGLEIEVIVENGEATVSGSVDSAEIAQDIVDTLETIPGIESVINEVRIS